MAEHVFAIDLHPAGHLSTVAMDGEDISSLLRGIRVESGVGQPTAVTLIPVLGTRATLLVRLPEAQITIATE